MSKFSFKAEFNQVYDYIIVHIKGLLKYETFLYAFDQIVNDDKFHLGMARIWNLTDADLSSFHDEDIWMASNYSTNFPKGICDVKVAFVSENSYNFYLLSQYKSISPEVQATFAIIDSLEKAVDWIIN